MRSSIALAALVMAPAVLSAPLAHDTQEIKEAIFFTETPSTVEKPSMTRPEDDLVSELSAVTGEASKYTGPIIVVEPPPIFDPPEPRPGSIFVSDTGLVIDALSKPPPMSFARPEKLSAFQGSHVHPQSNPYPPEDHGFVIEDVYTNCAWIHALSIFGAIATLLSLATILVWTVERALVTSWRNKQKDQLDARDLWADDDAEAALLGEKAARRRSNSAAIVLH